MEIISSMIFGLIGGITRVFVGLIKNKTIIQFSRLVFTLAASSIIGIFCSLLVNDNQAVSLLAGYAGTDFIESIYKMKGLNINKTKTVYAGSENKKSEEKRSENTF